ncbi:MAG: hypothetical protein K9J27_11330 [Bacteroidales bacterium]|nr:hypothetical protein [Bacteroidales bacterium]MCF8334542.1 hypothetical protein [Bacteroidales bacterium]
MSELDLNKIWDSDREKARDHYESLTDVEKLAKQKSENILNKIRRTAFVESIISTVVVAAMAVLFYFIDIWVFAVFMVFIIPVFILSYRLYRNYTRNLNDVNQRKVTESISAYVRMTKKYLNKVKFYIYYVLPIGYITGLAVGTLSNPDIEATREIIERLGIGLAIGVPLVGFMIWFFNRKYIKWLYGRHYKALKEVLENLEKEE